MSGLDQPFKSQKSNFEAVHKKNWCFAKHQSPIPTHQLDVTFLRWHIHLIFWIICMQILPLRLYTYKKLPCLLNAYKIGRATTQDIQGMWNTNRRILEKAKAANCSYHFQAVWTVLRWNVQGCTSFCYLPLRNPSFYRPGHPRHCCWCLKQRCESVPVFQRAYHNSCLVLTPLATITGSGWLYCFMNLSLLVGFMYGQNPNVLGLLIKEPPFLEISAHQFVMNNDNLALLY